MTQRQFCIPHVVENGKALPLQRVPFGEKSFDEAMLQRLLFDHPSLLPIDELEEVFGPPIPLARELNTPAGYVDLVYISHEGYLTLVETKLWRNPEARREVIAQIIDYATAMSKWSYTDLVAAVKSAGATGIDPVAECVSDAENFDSVRFIDAVSRNLALGRFLLLIVGDGIQEGVEHLAQTLAASPHLRFALALVELALFRESGNANQLLIQPRILVRTREVVRAVVEIRANVSPQDVVVTLPAAEGPSGGERRKLTDEVFIEQLATSTTPKLADEFRAFLAKAEELGIQPQYADASMSLYWHEPTTNHRFTCGSVYCSAGRVELYFVLHYYRKAGLDEAIGRRYVHVIANMFPGAAVREQGKPGRESPRVYIKSKEIGLDNLLPRAQEWLAAISEMMQSTEQAATRLAEST